MDICDNTVCPNYSSYRDNNCDVYTTIKYCSKKDLKKHVHKYEIEHVLKCKCGKILVQCHEKS